MSKWVRKWEVPKSKGGGTWTVAQADDGSWGCSCPVWKFRRQECKHIQLIRDDITSLAFGKANPLAASGTKIIGQFDAIPVVEDDKSKPHIPHRSVFSRVGGKK